MCRFLVRRIFYSLLIVLGVELLTFALFHVAAGDPAAAVLGKNPAPAEVESLRRELGADLPLIWGNLCRTETFASADLRSGILPPGVTRDDAGRAVFAPRLPQTEPVVARISEGQVRLFNARQEEKNFWRIVDPERQVTAEGAGKIDFFRVQQSPWHSQFLLSLGELVKFEPKFPYVRFLDFGRTLTTREPIGRILRRGVVPSLGLMLPVFLGELVFGVALALLAAAFKDRVLDRVLVLVSVAGMSVSYLVLIIFGQWFLGYYCNFFPVWGWGAWQYLTLPVLIGIVSGVGGSVRFYRTVFVDELKKEYLRTAAAKGCSPWRIYGVHLLRNASIPIITRASAALPFLFTGSLLLETFFGIPGLGFASIDALNNSDLQLLKALVLVSALLFVVLNLLADLAYAWADPRIRLE